MSTVCASCSTQLLAEATGLGTIPRGISRCQETAGYAGAFQPLRIGMRLGVHTECPVQWAYAPGALWPFGASGQLILWSRPQPD